METQIEVQMPCDENGLISRECPQCKGLFKVKLGTGLDTTDMYCPYCSHYSQSKEFLTSDQIKLFKSYALRYAMGQVQTMFAKTFKNTGNQKSGFSISYKKGNLPSIYEYEEKDLETSIICDNCGLNFAIYGAFANCPDCNSANQLAILKKSLEVTIKKLQLVNKIDEKDLNEEILKSCLCSAISSFDGFGKGFKDNTLPSFQGFYNLYNQLKNNNIIDLKTTLGEDDFKFTTKMFQVRHLYEHNYGVIDEDFNNKTKLELEVGRKYLLEYAEIEKLITILDKIGNGIYNNIKK